jgi:uncharacterized protein YcbK (DUF882 family)
MLRRLALLTVTASLLAGAAPRPGTGWNKEMTDADFAALLKEAPQPPDLNDNFLEDLEGSDLETYIFASGLKAKPSAPVNLGGDGRLTLARPQLGEKITAVYRRKDGTYDLGEINKIQRIMRSSGGGEETAPSIMLLEILDAVEDKFGGRGLVILSGYRTPRLNNKVPGAARYSTHMLGWAADIRVPGRTALQVAAFARTLRAGGVGYYPDAAFVHLDVGRLRQWTVRRAKPAPKK